MAGTATARVQRAPARRPPAPARAPERRPAGRGKRRATQRRPLRAIAVTVVVGSLLAVVVADGIVASERVALDRADLQITAAAQTHAAMQSDIAQRLAPPVVVTEAEHQLGMVSPAQVTYLPSVSLDVPIPPPVVDHPHPAAPAAAPAGPPGH